MRFLALTFAAASLALPVAMAGAGFFKTSASYGCQSPTAAISPLLTATALSGVLATAALILGAVTFTRVPPPRSPVRKLELALCSLPATLVLVSFVTFLVVFTAG